MSKNGSGLGHSPGLDHFYFCRRVAESPSRRVAEWRRLRQVSGYKSRQTLLPLELIGGQINGRPKEVLDERQKCPAPGVSDQRMGQAEVRSPRGRRSFVLGLSFDRRAFDRRAFRLSEVKRSECRAHRWQHHPGHGTQRSFYHDFEEIEVVAPQCDLTVAYLEPATHPELQS